LARFGHCAQIVFPKNFRKKTVKNVSAVIFENCDEIPYQAILHLKLSIKVEKPGNVEGSFFRLQ
jgi:hypothetical protein